MHRMIKTCACLIGLATASTGALARPIQIGSASYGANCGARIGNLTHALGERCNSRDTCLYSIDVPPNYPTGSRTACKADLVAEWSCGAGEFHRAEVRAAGNDGGRLVLTCVPSTGAGK